MNRMRYHGPRRWLGEKLRRLADRVDWYGAPRYMSGLSFYFEDHVGLVVDRWGHRGCPLMYRGQDDYEKAFSPAPPDARPAPPTRPNPGMRSM